MSLVKNSRLKGWKESNHTLCRNALLRLSTPNMTLIERLDWAPRRDERDVCERKGKSAADCANFVRLLAVGRLAPPSDVVAGAGPTVAGGEDSILACGTYAYAPQCLHVNVSVVR